MPARHSPQAVREVPQLDEYQVDEEGPSRAQGDAGGNGRYGVSFSLDHVYWRVSLTSVQGLTPTKSMGSAIGWETPDGRCMHRKFPKRWVHDLHGLDAPTHLVLASQAVTALAGFYVGEQYRVPWATVDVPQDLAARIFPFVEPALISLKASEGVNLGTINFLELLQQLRPFFWRVSCSRASHDPHKLRPRDTDGCRHQDAVSPGTTHQAA